MTTYSDPLNNTIVARRFRVAFIMAMAYAVFYVATWLATIVLVNLAEENLRVSEMIIAYNYLTTFLKYGLRIALFACLVAAAKRLQPTNMLLKIGSVVGTVGTSLALIVAVVSAVYTSASYGNLYDLSFSETGYMKVLMIICGNPVSHKILFWAIPIGLIICAASFVTHSVKVVKNEAIALVSVVAVERIVEWMPLPTTGAAMLTGVCNFSAAILTAVLFAALANHYKQA